MSALASVARHHGVSVSGCDLDVSGAADVAALGVTVYDGHDVSHLEGARAVVVSAAVPETAPELASAAAMGLPIVPRKRALAQLVAGGSVVAIGGTHGKTTTTVMTCELLAAGGLDPTGIAGGRVEGWGGNARVGGNALFVVEADEYDRAFLELSPDIAVVTNVEPEHLECYGSEAGLEEAFRQFLRAATRAVVSAEDVGVQRVMADNLNHVVSYGVDVGDLRATNVVLSPEGAVCTVLLPSGRKGTMRLRVPGLHNVRNALAALAVGHVLDLDLDSGLDALASYAGVGRRFERLGVEQGVAFVDDYAHHPTEVEAVLSAARQAFPERRLIVVFQPHLYSRTAREGGAMGEALAAADLVVVTDVYAAREQPVPGVTGARVADAARAAGVATEYHPDRDSLVGHVRGLMQDGDLVLTLGAGDVTRVGRELVAGLRAA